MHSIREQFLKRFKSAQGVADLWASLHEACYHYAIPNKNKFWRPKEMQGEARGTRVYDTTAIESTSIFVSKMHTTMTPPQTQWGYLEVDKLWMQDDDELVLAAQAILDDYMRKLFSYIHNSNFDVVINECYYDLAVGTSCIVVNQHTDKCPLLFTSVPINKLAIEESLTGRIDSWYRPWCDVKISEIQTYWPNAVLNDEMIANVMHNPDAKVKKIYEGTMFCPGFDKPYIYIVCVEDHILLQEELEVNPGIVWRFQKINEDVFGRGPIMNALPSIISLNEVAKIELASANLNVFKPYMAFSDETFNPYTFTLEPMSIIPISPIGADGQAPLIPLGDSSNPQFAQLTIMDLRAQIQRLLFAESPIPQDSDQPPSATELMINQQLMAQKMGPQFSRLQHEFLEPLFERCSYILDKMGILRKPKIDGLDIKFKYISPLALAKGQEQISRFTQFFQLVQGIVGPQMSMVYVNAKNFPFVMAELMQIDPRLLNSPEQVEMATQQMIEYMNTMQMQANQAQAEQGQEPAPAGEGIR